MNQEMKELMKKEAVRRMKMMNLHPNTVKDFVECEVINRSDRITVHVPMGDGIGEIPAGGLYWLNDDEKNIVKDIEERAKILVYHVSHAYFAFGECYDFFYVSSYKEQWEDERQDLELGNPLVYTHNKTVPDFSEFGYIKFKVVYGGVIRTE